MRFFTTLLIALGVGLAIYLARRRIRLALVTAGIAYLILLPLRLLFAAGEVADRFDELVWPLLGVGLVWVVLWQVSLAYQRRKEEAANRQPDER